MNKLEVVLTKLNEIELSCDRNESLQFIGIKAKLLVTIIFLLSLLSLSIYNLPSIIMHMIYPIFLCSCGGLNYIKIFKHSLVVLPFVLFIGILNPFYDIKPFICIGSVTLSYGWISFISIILRGVVSAQAIMILIESSGFNKVILAINSFGVPSILTMQLLFVYRYIYVLLNEALSMHRARISRSFGKSSYSIKTWSILIGQLFLRAIEHSNAIHQAMLSRGFSGNIPCVHSNKWNIRDSIFLFVWICVFTLIHLLSYSHIL